ncbi:PWWP domain-containing DNA repair factor 4-like [Castor canadensis]|uniref:PWWP domain-containing DNA repair factor 4-like n=1 Tax=Castor canadensis TaxID=51338 RepID=A0AC58LRB8_CASCN
MDAAEYVLCRWKGHLWPAKVLSRLGTSATSDRGGLFPLEVEVLSTDEKIQVNSTDITALSVSRIEALASSAGMPLAATDPPGVATWKDTAPSGQTRVYRKALRVALEIVHGRMALGQERTPQEHGTPLASPKGPAEPAHSGPHLRPRGHLRPRACLCASSCPCSHPCPYPRRPRKHRKQKGTLRRRLGQRGGPRSLLVRLPEKEDAPPGGAAQVHTAVSPGAAEMQAKASQSTSAPANSLTPLGAAGEQQGKNKAGPSTLVPSSPPVVGEGVWAKEEQQAPTGPKALKEEAWDPWPGTWAPVPQGSTTFLRSMGEDPGEGASEPGLEGAAESPESQNPSLHYSLRIANRKRKHQLPAFERGRAERPPQVRSKAAQTFASIPKLCGGLDGRTVSRAFGQEPGAVDRGAMVWFQFQDHPFWPAVVKSVNKATQTARVLLIQASLRGDCRGIRVPLRRLKPLHCDERFKLLRRASRAHLQGLNWCFSLIAHYREGVARGSFSGPFLHYYATDASYPIRKAIQEGDLREGDFPKVNYAELDDSEEEEEEEKTFLGRKGPCKKLLPDRMRAACDRHNQKLVDFIVRRKGADPHLLDIVKGWKPSRWLASFLETSKCMLCIETYLEDEDQLFTVVKHLQKIYEHTDETILAMMKGDKVRFVVEVLLPEAIIWSIAELDGVDYKEAEEKYLQGPPVHRREKELFDKNILKERRRRRSATANQSFRSPPAPLT